MNTIDIDTGGTFTDGVFHFQGRLAAVKVDTTPHDPVKCFLDCIDQGASELETTLPDLLQGTDVIRYATTAATNAIVQMQGPKIGLLVSAGAETDLYRKAEADEAPIRAFLDQGLVAGVEERTGPDGRVGTELDRESFRTATERLLDAGARLLVVVFGNSSINPANELRARELFEELLPGFFLGRPFLLLSHQVSPSGNDAERLNAAVVSGYLHGGLVRYLYRCDDALRRRGYRHPLLVVHSSGGVARVAKTKALNTYNSGPTAGVFGAAHLARRKALGSVVTMDQGGTSTDVAFIRNGRPLLSSRAEIGRVTVAMPMIDVIGLGGGGGSLVTVRDGALRVGPESAGAVPGPVCYDLGNSRPTVTDANLVLGLIAADNFLGGRRTLNVDRARKAIEESTAAPLGLEADATALRIREMLADTLSKAIRAEAEKRSFTLEDAALFAYGGAGALHAADIAGACGMSRFFMFPESPVFSAAGASYMDIRHWYEAWVGSPKAGGAPRTLEAVAARLRERALRDVRGEGFDAEKASLEFTLETRSGERIQLTGPEPFSNASERDSEGLLRLIATVAVAERNPERRFRPASGRRVEETRSVVWADGRKDTRIYTFNDIGEGERLQGPCLVESAQTTCVIPDGWRATIDPDGALEVRRNEEGEP